MTDSTDPTIQPDPDSYAEETIEVEQPRRAASAQFVVDTEVGSEAMLRDAMDPANQSLADALRLSFRVLQVVIAVLVVLFIVSGAKTIAPGQSGVAMLWGKILEKDGESALEPGLTFNWPYPAGEFVLFQAENRRVEVNNLFWPSVGRGRARTDALEAADIRDGLNPARDGYLLTADDEVAHMQLNGSYLIVDVRDYVGAVRIDQESRIGPTSTGEEDVDFVTGDQLMALALQRAAVHTAARMPIDSFMLEKESQNLGVRLKDAAQEMLDRVDVGVQITAVATTDVTPPFSIEKLSDSFDRASDEAKTNIERAQKRAEQFRIDSAGDGWEDAIALINAYERSVEESARDAEQTERLSAIYEHLESDAVGGQVAVIIGDARSYRSLVDSTLGSEAKRFRSLLPTYQKHPRLVVRQRWLETVGLIMLNPDVEVIWIPEGTSTFKVDVSA
ncbi:MAG: SPFH domain-containing protein, partial [Planctomycetota bacterium]